MRARHNPYERHRPGFRSDDFRGRPVRDGRFGPRGAGRYSKFSRSRSRSPFRTGRDRLPRRNSSRSSSRRRRRRDRLRGLFDKSRSRSKSSRENGEKNGQKEGLWYKDVAKRRIARQKQREMDKKRDSKSRSRPRSQTAAAASADKDKENSKIASNEENDHDEKQEVTDHYYGGSASRINRLKRRLPRSGSPPRRRGSGSRYDDRPVRRRLSDTSKSERDEQTKYIGFGTASGHKGAPTHTFSRMQHFMFLPMLLFKHLISDCAC